MLDYLDTADLTTDSLFLDMAPKIASEAQLGVCSTDSNFTQVATGAHGSKMLLRCLGSGGWDCVTLTYNPIGIVFQSDSIQFTTHHCQMGGGMGGWSGAGWVGQSCGGPKKLPCNCALALYEVVSDHVRHHWILRKKGQKINLGKYHQTTYTGIRDRKLYSTKGLCFAVTCAKLGYWQFKAIDSKKAPQKTGVLFSNH